MAIKKVVWPVHPEGSRRVPPKQSPGFRGNQTTDFQTSLPSLKLTSKAPENRGFPLEKEIPNWKTTIFRGELLVLGRVVEK